MHRWLRQQLERVSVRPALAKAIRYGLYHWDGLIRSLHDDHLELDTSIAEHAIYPVALEQKCVVRRFPSVADSIGRSSPR